jgi:hypothetical protein
METIALLPLKLFAICNIVTTLQKAYSFRASYSNVAKSVYFLSMFQHHCKNHIVFDQVTTPLQKACSLRASYSNIAKSLYFLTKLQQHCKNVWFLSKLQQHCKKRTVCEQIMQWSP